ncbi:hypothetical protein RHMOL_Rhmol08G0241300 [Rhododendron molle]|uniref:Uncharacterized protein n=1 Tax=Rhododendron molle TaxID=49168 RepID=A0ACC0MTU4_RHOML|nr:hypothetical protein RHMOL_Rhmol08G0241300 [Rhododendron molle]
MPDVTHGLCTFHLNQNDLKHLGHLFKDDSDFGKELNTCIFGYEDEQELEEGWKTLIKKYSLQDNMWMKKTWAIRKKWAHVYMKWLFTTGMRSTQLSESPNAKIKKFVKFDHGIVQFFTHFDRLVMEKRDNEIDSIFDSREKPPKQKLKKSPMSIEVAQFYTPPLFDLFHDEVDLSLSCKVKQHHEFEGEFSVLVENLRTFGILCGHAIKAAYEYVATGVEDMCAKVDKMLLEDVPMPYVPEMINCEFNLSSQTSFHPQTFERSHSLHLKGTMSLNSLFTIVFLVLPLTVVPALPVLPEPDPASIQPFSATPSLAATIPAFPEQSDLAGCPLDLPDELFHGVRSACAVRSRSSDQLLRSRCCPVLAAWLYSAYSETALGIRTNRVHQTASSSSYDLPLLPDDSEACVDGFRKALNDRGIELAEPNKTCDMASCYCGIRLHPLSCPAAFTVSENGKLVGDRRSVKRLERDCSAGPGLAGCSKCLNSLYKLKEHKTGNTSKSEDRTSKMHDRDCEVMGLTWLLAMNRSAYIHTVSSVLRAIMMGTDGSDPRSCSLNIDGMPLAVDSSEVDFQSSSTTLHLPDVLSAILISLIVSTAKF